LADKDQNIWVGHDVGFSVYNPITGAIKTYANDFANAAMCNMSAIFETADNKILIGTTEGLIIFDRKKDNLRQMPPLTNLNYITINNKRYDYQSVYTLPYGNYFIRLNFTGINFNDPDKVNYSVFIDNFSTDWSNFSPDREMPFTLKDGKYKFNIISVNSEGISQEEPFTFVIIIKKPWWRTTVAIIIWVLLLIGTVVLIIKIREKAQKETQEYLEKELEARTRVIRHQKEEIELQNIEITDSINYAKRIQTSILPDCHKLKETFADAFIIFKPKDIVSGDFYWFDWFDKNKFILVCADSTGHGVPGAFMSMIGSTLLRDIVMRQKVSKPSQILNLLDKLVFSTLNQNEEFGVTSDGMDMVVCEFDIKKRYVKFASAMRPLIIVIGGETFYMRGNRASIGGESVKEKYFDDQEYYLNEGDTIYLFSDGFTDQFGGTDGKKMKVSRLKTLIEQISDKPMDEQQSALSEYYDKWKGTYEQVDDILLMGIKM
jgi:serine phosphatase RsbU (regulator of sigma subunit)